MKKWSNNYKKRIIRSKLKINNKKKILLLIKRQNYRNKLINMIISEIHPRQVSFKPNSKKRKRLMTSYSLRSTLKMMKLCFKRAILLQNLWSKWTPLLNLSLVVNLKIQIISVISRKKAEPMNNMMWIKALRSI